MHIPFPEQFSHLWPSKNDREVSEAVEKLVSESRLNSSFFVMCGLSGILASLGILMQDTAVIISAMVLAPLLNPILAFAAGVTLCYWHLIRYALRSIIGSILFVMLVTSLLSFSLQYVGYPLDIQTYYTKFTQATLFFFAAAFVSGFSAVYAWLRQKGLAQLIGVAIAVSLIPFVSFMGIIWGLGDFTGFLKLLTNFSLNLLCITSGALCCFVLLGLRNSGANVKRQIEREIQADSD